MISRLLLLLACLVPAAAGAAGLGPPLVTPPDPAVPLGPVDLNGPPAETPPVAAPPFLLTLPDPASGLPLEVTHAGPPDPLPGPPDPLPGRPDSLPGPFDPLPGSFEPPVLPNLIGVVVLPPGAAEHVLGVAPPFGGELPAQAAVRLEAVPEPTTAALLLLGLAGLAARRR